MFEDGLRTGVRCTKLRQLANFQGPAPGRLPSPRPRSAVRRPNTRDYDASQARFSPWKTSFPQLVTVCFSSLIGQVAMKRHRQSKPARFQYSCDHSPWAVHDDLPRFRFLSSSIIVAGALGSAITTKMPPLIDIWPVLKDIERQQKL